MKIGKEFIFLEKRKSNQKILLVSSPISSLDNESEEFDYFAYLVEKLSLEIEEQMEGFDLVVKVPNICNDPQNSYEQHVANCSDTQAKIIDKAVKFPDEYFCIIVSPVDRDKLYENLRRWIKTIGYNRIFFIDQGFTSDDYEHFWHDNIPRAPYVQANWEQGGEIGGLSMAKLFQRQNISNPHIVIMGGNVGSTQRSNGFKKGLVCNNESANKLYPSYYECNGRYSKKTAREVFEPYLLSCIKDENRIHGVFACNDQMALGIREVLQDHIISYKDKFKITDNQQFPKIIGFDGIRDMTFLIDNSNEFLYDTVCSFPNRQVIKLVTIIKQMLINGKELESEKKFVTINCESYIDKDIVVDE